MTTVTFNGAVTAQVAAGEIVTLTVTKPDGTTDILTAQTLADKTFSAIKDYLPGDYTVNVHIDPDTQYSAADSSVAFNVALIARSITISVIVS